MSYIQEQATREAYHILRGLLADGWAICDYQPGDGTSYKLSFQHIVQPSWAPTAHGAGHGFVLNDVIVSWIGHRCYQFDLLNPKGFMDKWYVMEKMSDSGQNEPTGQALATLFNAIILLLNENVITLSTEWLPWQTEGADSERWLQITRVLFQPLAEARNVNGPCIIDNREKLVHHESVPH